MKLVILGILILSMFVGNADASFLDDKAGISAYTKATTAINLNSAKTVCRTTPEIITTNYFICSVPVPLLPETEDAHVYVSKNGWILAYYMKDVPVSKIVQWSNYNGGEITTTTLADIVNSVASAAGVSFSPIKYYDFKYPGANRLMMVVDWLPVAGSDSYQIKIPSNFVLSENSWSVRHKMEWRGHFNAWLDGNQFPDGDGTYNIQDFHVRYGSFTSLLAPNVFHTVGSWARANYDGFPAGVNTVLVYRQ